MDRLQPLKRGCFSFHDFAATISWIFRSHGEAKQGKIRGSRVLSALLSSYIPSLLMVAKEVGPKVDLFNFDREQKLFSSDI